jgi:hypothetical protein
VPAFSVISITVQFDTAVNNFGIVWGSVGYTKVRSNGDPTAYHYRFCEVQGEGDDYDQYIDFANPGIPAVNESHEFKIECDNSYGVWTGYYDGQGFGTLDPIPIWEIAKGLHVRFFGEIDYFENDMAGNASDSCKFSECMSKRDGFGYADIDLTYNVVYYYDEPNEWNAHIVNASTLAIWDVNPKL